MPTGALFGNSTSGPGSTGGNKHIVEMRAGKMTLKGHTVYPDKRKGLIYVYQSDDSLMHFCWQDRSSGVVEDDLIIFPDDCEYIRLSQCTTGRAYLLKFKTTNRRFFFWLQEPHTERDEEHCKRINEVLNNPSSNIQSSGNNDQDLQSLLNNMSQSQLMQLFGGGVGQIGGLSSLLGTMNRPSSVTRGAAVTPAVTHRTTASTPSTNTSQTASAAATAGVGLSTPQNAAPPPAVPDAPKPNRTARPLETTLPSTNPIQLVDLQNFLQGISPVPAEQQSVDLSTALTSEGLSGILNNSESMQQLQNHLPAVEEGTTEEQLRSTLASPQFQQAVSQFSSALESGQLGPIVSQLVVNPEAVAAASSGNMQEFVKALEKSNKNNSGKQTDEKKKEETKNSKKNDKDDDEGMQLD